MQRVEIWDEVSPINGVPAESVLENRPDLVAAHGDIILVVDAYDRVNEIQIGATIAANYGMEPGMELQAIADAYMVKKQEEEEAAEVERMSVEELQEEVAILSYDVNANTWTALTASDMPFTAGYYSYALVGNTYYMFGGQYFSSSGVQVLTNYRNISRCFVLKL